MLTTFNRFIVRLLFVLSLLGVLFSMAFDATLVEAGECVGAPSGNSG